jgi:peroxiredoxin
MGDWRGIIHTQGQELPFNFSLDLDHNQNLEVVLINGAEKIPITETEIINDSIFIPMHIFDADLVASFSKNEMRGFWRKNYAEDFFVPFSASYGGGFRFIDQPGEAQVNISGRWEVYFHNASGKSLAVGEFSQVGNKVSGTFLRPSGDYRYLIGEVEGQKLYLSTFDGEHAYLFTATVHGDQMEGDFYSGKTRHETWSAERNEDIELPGGHLQTFLREGYETVDFKLPDLNGNLITLGNPKFDKKVVIIQIFGTWCSNCMDETRFLSEWYNKNKDRGVEIVAIAFERKDDFQYAKSRIVKLKKRFNIQYEFLFGGNSDKSSTFQALPMLKGTVSFPTTIFIDRSGKVRRIHTGFTGPGTGEHYHQFVKEFNVFMSELLGE